METKCDGRQQTMEKSKNNMFTPSRVDIIRYPVKLKTRVCTCLTRVACLCSLASLVPFNLERKHKWVNVSLNITLCQQMQSFSLCFQGGYNCIKLALGSSLSSIITSCSSPLVTRGHVTAMLVPLCHPFILCIIHCTNS